MSLFNQNFGEYWGEQILKYGYLGVFLFSMISNSIPYAVVPYLLLLIIIAKNITSYTGRVLLILLSTLGAVLGKLIVYFMGYGLSPIITSWKYRSILDILRRSRSIFIAVTLFASLPLPDDVLFIPLGAIRYDVKRYILALFIGKFIITYLTVNLGIQAYWLLEEAAGFPIWISIPIMIILTIYVMYIITNVNWNLIIETGAKKSVLHAFLYLIYEVLVKTALIPIYVYRRIRGRSR
ncbi:MAG: VTT domain-containing protein [Desulfurococcaceae archaeon]